MRRVVACIALIALSFVTTRAEAKCPFLRYAFEGTLQLPNDVNASGIRIVVFLDDLPYMSAYPPTKDEADYLVPQETGRFEGVSYFSTASGRVACKGIAKELTLVILGDGIRARRVVLDVQRDRSVRKRGGLEIDLGRIAVRSNSAPK